MDYSGVSCSYCKADLFLKAKVYTKAILAPLTHEQEIVDELVERTGETYVFLQKRFCPMCGRKVAKLNGQM